MKQLLNRLACTWRWFTMNDLAPSTTAIIFHWTAKCRETAQSDKTFTIPRILRGAQLDEAIDALLEEHVPHSTEPVITEISVFWCLPDGCWETIELQSHYYPREGANNPTTPS